MHNGLRSVRHALPAVLVLWLVMGSTQFVLAWSGLWSMAAFGAGIAGLAAVAFVVRLGRYRGTDDERAAVERAGSVGAGMGMAEAMSAYGVLLVVVLVGRLVAPVEDVLRSVAVAPSFPETQTALGWVNPAAAERPLYVFGHAGALILYTCVFAFLIYWLRGRYSPGAAGRVVRNTLRGSVKPTIGIVFMVGMAMFMTDSGMTYVLALGLSHALGAVYPLVAPFIGALGAFMTGSNTNSNVLFAPLQQRTAAILGLDVR
jgi:lactate permease